MAGARPFLRLCRPVCALLLALSLAGAGTGAGTDAHAQDNVEMAVKATYIAKFPAYIDWPPQALATDAPILLCVVGADIFGSLLDKVIAGQMKEGHPLIVRRLPVIDRDAGCAIAFLGGSTAQSVPDAVRVLNGAPVLTVTDARRDRSRGIIHFQTASNRVRFHIDQATATAAGLTISSRLLSLALTVRQKAGVRGN